MQDLISAATDGKVTLEAFAAQLPTVYPAVAAGAKTWRLYAIAFVLWLEYAGLIELRGQTMSLPSGLPSKARLLGGDIRGRQKTFPHTRPEAAFAVLRSKLVPGTAAAMKASTNFKALTDLNVLGVLDADGLVLNMEVAKQLVDKATGPSTLLGLLPNTPGGGDAISLLQSNPAASSEAVGAILRDAYGLPWVDSTTRLAGAKFRAWASAAGVKVLKPKKKKKS